MSIRGAKPYEAGKVGTLSRNQHASYRGRIVRNYRGTPTHLETYDYDSPSQSYLETYTGLPRSHFDDATQCLHDFLKRPNDGFGNSIGGWSFWRHLLAAIAVPARHWSCAGTADVFATAAFARNFAPKNCLEIA